jgi:predicted phage-related endonuclease
VFFNVKQGCDEWFEVRKNKITGSIAVTVLDNNSSQTYWQLVNDKADVKKRKKMPLIK